MNRRYAMSGEKEIKDQLYKTEVKDGMRIEWNVPIKMDDGAVLRVDVFRPAKDGKYPVIMNMDAYGKGTPFGLYPDSLYYHEFSPLLKDFPEIAEGSSLKYVGFEAIDPERWVPHGYAHIRVDARGSGCSPGYLDMQSPREIRDYYNCIEWAGTQPWSNGKVGLLGVSYPAWNQWLAAALHPPHLAAIIPWEGAVDWYRDVTHQGGILSQWSVNWVRSQLVCVQYGVGKRGPVDPITGDPVGGPETLSEEELVKNRIDFEAAMRCHPLDDSYYKERTADLSEVTVPLLSAANWNHWIHTRGNFEGYMRAASKQKWLEVHGKSHLGLFYANQGIDLQKRFFDHFLKGIDNDWKDQPLVQLYLRKVDGTFVMRGENEWPIARTRWTKFYLDVSDRSLTSRKPSIASSIEYEGLGQGVTFTTPSIEQETEITGPVAAKVFLSSSTHDADLFVILRLFDPDGKEVTIDRSPEEPHTPISVGWLRASHRKLDQKLTREWRPYHTHDTFEPLEPGKVYELDVEIWPTSIIVPPGYRIALTIKGKEYVWSGYEALDKVWNGYETLATPRHHAALTYRYESVPGTFAERTGGAGWLHNDPRDRPAFVFGGKNRLYVGGDRAAYLLLPIIPPK